MTQKEHNNLVAYGILTGSCLLVALIRATFPELFVHGPPSWQVVLSLRGTAIISLLGLIGVFFLNRSSLRGLWDADIGARDKVLIPAIAGIAVGLVNMTIRRFTPIDAVLAEYIRSLGAERIAPAPLGATLAYLSGGILVNIVYFLILIPPIVYLVSDRLLKGRKQGVVYWSIATPLALFEPLTNPPLDFSIHAFGTIGAIGIAAFSAVFTLMQVWFMRRSGFVALVAARSGLYAITHLLYPLLYPPP